MTCIDAFQNTKEEKAQIPVTLAYFEEYSHVAVAFQREKQIQGWRREKKHALIQGVYIHLPESTSNF